MNKDRRKQLAEIAEHLLDLRNRVEQLQGEEQEGFENLPEGLRQGERGQAGNGASRRADGHRPRFD